MPRRETIQFYVFFSRVSPQQVNVPLAVVAGRAGGGASAGQAGVPLRAGMIKGARRHNSP